MYEADATYVTNDLAMVHDVHLPAAKNDALRLECIFHLYTHSHTHTVQLMRQNPNVLALCWN